MFKIKKKISASTLVETIVSSIIILLVYSFFLIIFLFHTKSNNTVKVYCANNAINKIIYELNDLDSLENEQLLFNDIIIKKKIIKIDNFGNGYIISLDVLDPDSLFLFNRSQFYFNGQ